MKKNQRKSILLTALSALMLAVFLLQTAPVSALDYGASDVIYAINSLRAEYGLQAYTVSQSLTEIAQTQAEYMASIGTLTHERADGSGVPTTSENIAYGPVSRAMDSWVDDQLHFDTLIGWSSGQIGVGIAESGGVVYICLNYTRDSSTVFSSIPFTQAPGQTAATQVVPAATTAAVDTTAADSTETDKSGAIGEEGEEVLEEMADATPVAVTFEQEETPEQGQTSESEDAVSVSAPDNTQEVVIESNTGKIVAYVLIGLGAVGLGGSVYGMLYALRQMGNKSKAQKKKQTKPKKSSRKKKSTEAEPEDTTSSQEIPHEAQEE